MAREASTVVVVIARRHDDPGLIRWTVRHNWWGGPAVGTRDRVVASGEARVPLGERSIPEITRLVLEAALEDLLPF